MHRSLVVLLGIAVSTGFMCQVECVAGEGWTQFLGDERNGQSPETGLNLDWNANSPRVLWKSPLGGGFASVIVVEGRVYSLAERAGSDFAVAFDAESGEELWATRLGATFLDQQRQGPGPRATPTWHQGKLYCLLGGGDLLRIDAGGGAIEWRTNVFTVSGAPDPANEFFYWGMSASPLIEDDLVIVQPGGSNDNSVIAIDKQNGKLVWGAGNDPAGYGSPIVVTAAGKRQIVATTGQSLLGIDPQEGALLWRYAHGNKYNCNCATPLWNGETLFVSTAYGTGCAALEIVREGEQFSVKERWRNKALQSQFPTSMLLDGFIYGPHGDLGAVTFRCLDLGSGQVKWMTRELGKCSPIAAEGHLFCLTEGGDLVLVEASPQRYIEKGRLAELLAYRAWAPPALVDGRLYARDQKYVVCVDLRRPGR